MKSFGVSNAARTFALGVWCGLCLRIGPAQAAEVLPAVGPDPAASSPGAGSEAQQSREPHQTYLRIALLLGYHYHNSHYERPDFDFAEQKSNGGGFGGLVMIGDAAQPGVRLVAALSAVYVPNADVHFDGFEGSAAESPKDFESSIWAATLGLGLVYHAPRVFRMGGILGLAAEHVPMFTWPTNGSEDLLGLGAGLWLGLDWELATESNFGIIGLAETRGFIRRGVGGASSGDTQEQSATLSLGASLTFF